MIRRRILPEEEELWDAAMVAAFVVTWYGMLIPTLWKHTISGINAAIFIVGGILPLYTAFAKGRAVLSCRKKRREALGKGRCCRGIIRQVVAEKVPYRGRNQHIYYRTRYHLVIEKLEEGFDYGMEIKTGAYRVPVHRYLKSREVKLYSDASGWKWYVEGLQCGMFRQPPIVSEMGDCEGGSYTGDILFRIIFITISILMLLQSIL